MNSRKLFALFLVLALTGSALAVQQQRLYKEESSSDIDPAAEGVIGIQQHSVFVEIIVEQEVDREQIHQFAAVVGLVKKCKKVRNVFDNAVLWFNDQFLFGNKSVDERNVTPPDAMGYEPNQTLNVTDDMLDSNYDAAGAPDRDGFASNQTIDSNGDGYPEEFYQRWGGCYIPDGFVHAIGADDPYTWNTVERDSATVNEQGTGVDADQNGSDDASASGSAGTGGQTGATTDRSVSASASASNETESFVDEDEEFSTGFSVCDNICLTKQLINLDNDCEGCIFEYVGTFYITDPNDHRWMIDKFVYPLDMAGYLGFGDDPTNCHLGAGFACGLEADRHRDRAEDDGIPENSFYDDGECEDNGRTVDPEPNREDECADGNADDAGTNDGQQSSQEPDSHAQGNENFDNHCYDGPDGEECAADKSDPTDSPNSESLKLTTKEPLYTVHIQVDPYSPTNMGFPDEAIWQYRDGVNRLGMPYHEGDYDANGNHQAAPGSLAEFCHSEAVVTDPGPYKPEGNTVECAIEYNFLIAVDFEAFDDIGVDEGIDNGLGSADVASGGENEIIRNAKDHGTGSADDSDKAWQGNSHPYNPKECERVYADPSEPTSTDGHNWDEEGLEGNHGTPECQPSTGADSGPQHAHDAVALDMFFHAKAPYFVMENPYWDNANETDTEQTHGTPPMVTEDCTDTTTATGYRSAAVQARIPIVCDVDAVDGYHLHDGSQTPTGYN
ncbi:MAG: hypothetical protein R3185_00025 [Candidatus Thermoplasmatota archaeon]|nr:hypothetical protein [Candidatus Thermoplasmatota archaeon]